MRAVMKTTQGFQETCQSWDRRIRLESEGEPLVPEAGLEPARLAAEDFKSPASAVSPLRRRGNSTVGTATFYAAPARVLTPGRFMLCSCFTKPQGVIPLGLLLWRAER